MSDGVLIRRAADEVVLLDTNADRVFGVQGVGARVVQLLEDRVTLGEILQAVQNEFDVDESTAQSDLIAFVSDLESRRLVTKDDPVED